MKQLQELSHQITNEYRGWQSGRHIDEDELKRILKTPIATISIASDSILNEKVINNKAKVRFFTEMIKKENLRINEQVERILQIARLDRKEFKLIAAPRNRVKEDLGR